MVVKVLELEYGQLLETGCRDGIGPCLVAQNSPEGAVLRAFQFPLNRVAPNPHIGICCGPSESVHENCVRKGENDGFLMVVCPAVLETGSGYILGITYPGSHRIGGLGIPHINLILSKKEAKFPYAD